MNDNAELRIEYIEARRVLLDAVVLIGAQAIYLRTEGRLPTYQPFTTDADLVIDPAQLADVRCRPDQVVPAELEMAVAPIQRPLP